MHRTYAVIVYTPYREKFGFTQNYFEGFERLSTHDRSFEAPKIKGQGARTSKDWYFLVRLGPKLFPIS